MNAEGREFKWSDEETTERRRRGDGVEGQGDELLAKSEDLRMMNLSVLFVLVLIIKTRYKAQLLNEMK